MAFRVASFSLLCLNLCVLPPHIPFLRAIIKARPSSSNIPSESGRGAKASAAGSTTQWIGQLHRSRSFALVGGWAVRAEETLELTELLGAEKKIREEYGMTLPRGSPGLSHKGWAFAGQFSPKRAYSVKSTSYRVFTLDLACAAQRRRKDNKCISTGKNTVFEANRAYQVVRLLEEGLSSGNPRTLDVMLRLGSASTQPKGSDGGSRGGNAPCLNMRKSFDVLASQALPQWGRGPETERSIERGAAARSRAENIGALYLAMWLHLSAEHGNKASACAARRPDAVSAPPNVGPRRRNVVCNDVIILTRRDPRDQGSAQPVWGCGLPRWEKVTRHVG
ncbi:hypothetical protein EI94DRAFT_1702249 [Lactarius quietus]|nr:hypothetical protein EI94DRAFT_1702249 [Lactarius quietus]